MTDLHYGLLGVGAFVIALVYGYNQWQEHRFRQKTREAFQKNQGDPLLDAAPAQVRDGMGCERLEPRLNTAGEAEDRPDTGLPPLSALEPDPVLPAAEPLPTLGADDVPLVAPEPQVAAAPLVEPALPDLATDVVPPVVAVAAEPVELPAEAEYLPVPPLAEEALVAEAVPVPAGPSLDQDDCQAVARALLDPSLDFIATVRFDPPVRLPAWPRIGVERQVQMVAKLAHGDWVLAGSEPPAAALAELDIGLQLVDRRGLISEGDIQRFNDQVLAFAAGFNADVALPQRDEVLREARDLDAFCAEVDVLVGINLVAGQPFFGTKLRSLAEANGMKLEADGQFHAYSDSGSHLYTLMSSDSRPFVSQELLEKRFSQVTLLFDVPRVAGCATVFDRAVLFAQQLARSLKADLVDDAGRPLTEAGLQTIRQQLKAIHSRMDDRGIAAGSVTALRLFA